MGLCAKRPAWRCRFCTYGVRRFRLKLRLLRCGNAERANFKRLMRHAMDEEQSRLTLARLAAEAHEVAEHSYSPYSGFRVGAALLLSNGETVTGTNVENVSYGLTICAERAAVFRAVAQFGAEIRVVAAAVVNLNSSASPPCGACRQVLAEFMDADAPLSFPADAAGMVVTFTATLQEILPYGTDLRLK